LGARGGGWKETTKKGSKNEKKIFFDLNKYQSVKHVSTCIFQGLFKNIVFRSIALVTKKLWAILDFFSKTGLFSALYLINLIKYFFNKKSFKLFRINRPPPRLFRVKC